MEVPISHGCNLRIGRFSEVGRIYLITTVTLDRHPVFADWRLGRLVAREIAREQDDGRVRSLAWVLMPDHLHWLLELRGGNLSGVIQRMKSRSAIAVNRSAGTSGPLWQARFYDQALRREDDIKAFARYVIANPIRAGLVKRVADYPLWDAQWV